MVGLNLRYNILINSSVNEKKRKKETESINLKVKIYE
jgi:hypothetical protein